MKKSDSMANISPSKPWSETGKGRLIVLVGVLGLFGLVFWWAKKARQMVTPAPMLAVDEQYLSFGEVWEDREFKWRIPITNISKENLTIVQFAASCNCVVIEPKSLIIAPGKTVEIQVILDLTKPDSSKDNSWNRTFQAQIVPLVEGKSPALPWKIQGKVRKAMLFSEDPVVFEEDLISGNPIKHRIIRAMVDESVNCLSATCVPSLGRVELERSLENKQELALKLCPNADISVGHFSFNILLKAVSQDSHAIPDVVLPVRGNVVEVIQPEPADIGFEPQIIGKTVEKEIVFRNVNKKPCSWLGLESSPRNMTVKLLNDSPTLKTFKLSCTVTELGNRRYTVSFLFHTKERGRIKIPIEARTYGLKNDQAATLEPLIPNDKGEEQ